MATNTQTLSAVGTSNPVPIEERYHKPPTPGLSPSVLVIFSPGAVLTCTVQVTGDSMGDPSYSPANGNWAAFDGLAGLTASANGVLVGRVTGFRLNVTAYTSGSVTIQVVQ